jgi:predicted alpha/beta superfamily hydrolase
MTCVFATQAMPGSIKDSIASRILKETRVFEVILPQQYDSDTSTYDVWYVLDGEWNTHTFSVIHAYLQAIGFAPPIIIVSVPNRYVEGYNYRDRDLTPTVTSEIPNSGGAPNFLGFLGNELMPVIKGRYRISGRNGIFGGSFGGLFTLYALLQKPALFKYYAVADPALHYDQQYLPKLAARLLPTLTFSNTVLNIGGRSGLSYSSMGRDAMDSVLKATSHSGLRWHSALYEDETHNSSTFKSNYDGLKFAYQGYSSLQTTFHLTGGIVLRGKPIKMLIETDHADIRYTTDGTEPSDSSRQADEYLITDNPSFLKVKSFSHSGLYDRIIPVPLVNGDYLQPKDLQSKQTTLPELTTSSKISKTGTLSGILQIPSDGYYILQATPSEGTRVYFNDSLWISYDSTKGHARQTVILPLRKGKYILKLDHPNSEGNPPLYFGVYQSKDGQDDWWKTPLVRN